MQAKADLHCHTKYSDRPSEWFLRRIGAPESFTEPMELYRICKARGMQFVTVSDHNRIDGALSIAHLPDTFISCEVTTYFPEDGCKVHICVHGITEAQFQDIQQARESIYDLHRYLVEKEIIASVAHVLYAVNGRMTVDHFERLILMFNRFEGLNGCNHRRIDQVANAILRHLNPQMIADMANRQNLTPTGNDPWRKTFTGGSDDHSGLYLTNAYTVTPPAQNVTQYLDHLRRGDHEMAGGSGTSLRVAHAFYQIGYGYYRERYLKQGSGGLVGEFLKRLAPQPGALHQQRKLGTTVSHGIKKAVWKMVSPIRRRRMSETDRLLMDEFVKFLGLDEQSPVDPARVQDLGIDEKNFATTCRICHMLGFRFLKKLVEEVKKGRFEASLQAVAAMGPIALSVTPYLAAFKNMHKDRWLLQAVGEHFATAHHLRMSSDRKAWVTDQLDMTDAVTARVHDMFQQAKVEKKQLTAITCRKETPGLPLAVQNFEPVGEFNLPELQGQVFEFPPFLEMLRYIDQQEFSELYLSGPSPIGLAGLAAGKILGLRLTGIYHRDVTEHVFKSTKDEMFEDLARTFIRWYYQKMDVIYVPSEEEKNRLMSEGYEPAKLALLPKGFAELWDPYQGKPSPMDQLRMAPYQHISTKSQARRELLEVG